MRNNATITFRVPVEEKEAWQASAFAAQMTLGNWLRARVLESLEVVDAGQEIRAAVPKQMTAMATVVDDIGELIIDPDREAVQDVAEPVLVPALDQSELTALASLGSFPFCRMCGRASCNGECVGAV